MRLSPAARNPWPSFAGSSTSRKTGSSPSKTSPTKTDRHWPSNPSRQPRPRTQAIAATALLSCAERSRPTEARPRHVQPGRRYGLRRPGRLLLLAPPLTEAKQNAASVARAPGDESKFYANGNANFVCHRRGSVLAALDRSDSFRSGYRFRTWTTILALRL